MNLEQTYQKIISELSQGHRGLVRLSEDETQELKEKILKAADQELEKILCIIEHSIMPENKFEAPILTLLTRNLSDPLMIFTLNCARRHIVEARFQRGQRLEFEFLEALKKLLHHENPEIVEWTLRLIEGCGNQGIYFLREFDKIKPPPWKWFNAHQRAVREIIALLEKRWSVFEKPRP
jgi:hypothetical protein